MIVKIVCAGFNSFKNLYKKEKDEYIVAVDGGIIATSSLNLIANIAIGDFDSSDIERYGFSYEQKISFPKEKNASDLELAVDYISDMGFDRIEIYNGSGNRLDHFLAIIRVMIKYSHLNIHLLDDINDIFIIEKSNSLVKDEYKYVSFFATDDKTKITLKGFKYPLDGYILDIDDSICLSNEIIDIGIIETDKKIIAIKSKER
ncbi:MAG: thiamine diphosphokinase [Bacilli bacterium]|nr:thiamine diphosphokinase [Bacilli bacterium]